MQIAVSANNLSAGWSRTDVPGVGPALTASDPAAELAIPLNVTGSYTLRLDFLVPAGCGASAIQVKLSSQPVWRRLRPMRFIQESRDAIQSVDALILDVRSGDRLELRIEPECRVVITDIALRPAAALAAAAGQRDVAVVLDTCMTLGHYTMNRPTDLHAILQPYVDSHVTHIAWGTGVGTYSPLYGSKRFGWHGQEQKQFLAPHRERAAAAMRLLMDAGNDPLSMAVEYAHAHGLQLWANHRISKNHAEDFRNDYPGGRFLMEHRDKLVLEADGRPHHQTLLSHAYPEIRQATVDLLVEQARHGVDGLYIDFRRKPPIVGWEKRTVDDFVARHGFDPREYDRSDWKPRWYEHLASYPTQLLRELRSALKPVEQQLGRSMPVVVNVGGGWRFTSNRPACFIEEGLDPFAWAREGLVDIVVPGRDLWLQTECLDRYVDGLAGTHCKVWGAVGLKVKETHGADTDPWRYLQAAHDYFGQGAPGIVLWEAYDLPSVPQVWNTIRRRIGSFDELQNTFGRTLGRFDGSDKFQRRLV